MRLSILLLVESTRPPSFGADLNGNAFEVPCDTLLLNQRRTHGYPHIYVMLAQ